MFCFDDGDDDDDDAESHVDAAPSMLSQRFVDRDLSLEAGVEEEEEEENLEV